LIRKSSLTGKFTKAHEFKDNDLLKIVAFWANCFHAFHNNRPLNILESVNLSKIIPNKDNLKSLLKSVAQITGIIATGSDATPVALRVDKEVLDTDRSFAILSYQTISTTLEKRKKKERQNLDPYIMRTLIGNKIYDDRRGSENLIKANKVALKAKSVFIHLSIVEEGNLFHLDRFSRMHPFTDFIPEIIAFLTQKYSSVSLGPKIYRNCIR